MPTPTRSVSQWRHHASVFPLALLLLCTPTSETYAAFEYERGSVTSYALGGVIASDNASALDLLINPAAPISGSIAAEGWISRLYNVDDFELGAGAIAVRYRAIVLGVSAVQLTGSDFYWERETSGIVAISPSSRLRAGIRFDRRELEYAYGYGVFDLTSVALGLWWQPNSQLDLFAAINDLNRPRFSDKDVRLLASGNLGVGYRLSPAVSVLASQVVSSDYSDRLKIGQRLRLAEQLCLLMGLSTNPTELSGGVVFDFLGFAVEYGYRDNVYLGGTHRVGMSWRY